MTNINTRGNVVTIINVFTVEPEKQDALVTLLTRATDETVRHMPGFISANIHRSVDGVRVTNYAQWRSRADLEAMLRHPAAMPHLREATELATNVDPHVYEVAAVRGGRSIPSRMALGAMATGAMAIGAYAVGALAIGRWPLARSHSGTAAFAACCSTRFRSHASRFANSSSIGPSPAAIGSFRDLG